MASASATVANAAAPRDLIESTFPPRLKIRSALAPFGAVTG
jgi:hypothetical protein